MYLSIGNYTIPKGNFAFISDVTHDTDLFRSFYEAEKYLKINCKDFAHKMRMAFEEFALHEYTLAEISRQQLAGESVQSKEEIRKNIIKEIKKPSSVVNYKTLVIDRCRGREKDFAQMLFRYAYLKYSNSDVYTIRRILGKYIRCVHSFGSENSHPGIGPAVTYGDCHKMAASFFEFLRTYYRLDKTFYNTDLAPVNDYIPVQKQITENMGLRLDVGKYLYIKEKGNGIQFFVFSREDKQISDGRRRDIDVVEKLWEDNYDDPSNVIRQIDHITGCTDQYNYRVYSLPGQPLKLTKSIIGSISLEEKKGIIMGICNGLLSIHNYNPPLFHRNICPDAFYIFHIKGRYKALLAKFDYAKDTDPSVEYTVLKNVENNVKDQSANGFYAPEVISAVSGQSINWEKADIFSLGKLSLYILTGETVLNDDIEGTITCLTVNDAIKQMLLEMVSIIPENRPTISEVITCLSMNKWQ